MSNDAENRRTMFQKSDIFWFLALPLLMAAGFFGFRYYQQSHTDQNLQLVAKFSDDVSVELKGIAFYSAIVKPGTRWWKPNGVDFPDFKPDTSSFRPIANTDSPRMIVFEINTTSTRQPEFRIRRKNPHGMGGWWGTDIRKSLLFFTGTVDEGYFAVNDFTVEMSTRGTQTIGHLTLDVMSTEVSVSGTTMRFEIIDSEDGKDWDIVLHGSRRATQFAMVGQVRCKVLNADIKNSEFIQLQRATKYNSKVSDDEFSWSFPKSDWTDIEISLH